jgi:membrane-bound serine protease (ClpP class)
MKKLLQIIPIFLVCLLLQSSRGFEIVLDAEKAAVIPCKDMIDDGLYKSIQRRTQLALAQGADYLIYEIGTYGGFLDSADNISKYFILREGWPKTDKKVRTVAYITTEAISAGSMISVSCQDIIMRENTTIGDCAPITLGGKLEGVEREKTESFVRGTFERAAEANGYPKPLLKAMVTMQIEVYRVKNLESGDYEFFESDDVPKDPNKYDLDNKELIVKDNELLTLTASKAMEYGIARAVVKDRAGVLDFLAKRDNVTFAGEPMVLEVSWSEEMVRWLYSPAVMGVLVMIALLGVYLELSTPGIGLPGLVAAICFAIIIGSKYLAGMANWVEVALFIVGVILLMVEIFLLPGFGIAGTLGIIFILVGLFGMLIKNPPDSVPWPQSTFDWQILLNGLLGLSLGFIGFVILALLLARYLPKIPVAGRLVLSAPQKSISQNYQGSTTDVTDSFISLVKVGQKGISISQLHPAGKAGFGDRRIDVVSRGELIEADRQIMVVLIEGNRIVVKEVSGLEDVT